MHLRTTHEIELGELFVYDGRIKSDKQNIFMIGKGSEKIIVFNVGLNDGKERTLEE